MPTSRLISLPCGVLVVVIAACHPPRVATPNPAGVSTDTAVRTSDASAEGASTLGSGDLIEIRVFQETDLSGAYRLSPEGTIDYPLCGKVKLSSMTSSGAADVLTQCLQGKYLKWPQVSVLVREYNSQKIYIFGEVQKPGTFPYDENMTIIQAITLAGGFTKVATKNNINVTRTISGVEKKIRVPVEDIGVGREKNFLLRPGDIVFVPESFF